VRREPFRQLKFGGAVAGNHELHEREPEDADANYRELSGIRFPFASIREIGVKTPACSQDVATNNGLLSTAACGRITVMNPLEENKKVVAL
jgi:hypothetical protein